MFNVAGKVLLSKNHNFGLLLVDLYTKPKCSFISFRILGAGRLIHYDCYLGGILGMKKNIYRTLYLLGRQRENEFREISLSGPFHREI